MKPEYEARFLNRKSGDGDGNKAGRLNHAVWQHNSMSMCGRRVARHGMEYTISHAETSEITCPVCIEKSKF
jgi:hypothetical protein